MKVTLIELPHIYLMQQRTQAPLGIMYLASILEEVGIDVNIVRLISLDESDPENFIPESDLYGISSVSLDYSSAKIVGKWLKERGGGKVLIGGYHATVETKSVFEEKMDNGDFLWDSVCVGESEKSIIKIVEDVKNKKLKRLYENKDFVDIDSLPFPARHLIRDQGGSIFAYDKHYSKNRLSTVISSSRGCPFNCCFCSTRSMWKGKVRFRSFESISKEIENCITEYGIREFRFSDELFTVNKKRTIQLMDWLEKKEIHWKCSTRSDCVDKDILLSMKRGGCKEIAFGVESADENVLSCINKKEPIDKSITALENCAEIGINTRVLMMINTPGENSETVSKNINFLEKVPYTCASLSVFKPLPGSPVWKDPDKFGIKILSRDLDRYNIYMWINGEIDENVSEDVFLIKTLPDVDSQIRNRKKMIDYFYIDKKMNEIEKAIYQKDNLMKKDIGGNK